MLITNTFFAPHFAHSLAVDKKAEKTINIRKALSALPEYEVTPLHQLDRMAEEFGIGSLLLKDETSRLGQTSFKALGGLYAVAARLARLASRKLGKTVCPSDLIAGSEVDADLADEVFVTASAGNHGIGVVNAARRFDVRAVIVLPKSIPATFESHLKHIGADVIRYDGDYDAAMEHARVMASTNNWCFLSDFALDDTYDAPFDVMVGYSVIAKEVVEQVKALGVQPTHVFLQCGVGSFAAAMVRGLRQDKAFSDVCFISVEPDVAPCVLESLESGKPKTIIADQPTKAGLLNCGSVSAPAWPLLRDGLNFAMTIDDVQMDAAVNTLEKVSSIQTTPSGAAGVAGLQALLQNKEQRSFIGLNERSVALAFITEGRLSL